MPMTELETLLLKDLGESCTAVLGTEGTVGDGGTSSDDSLVAVVGFSGSHIRGAVGVRLPMSVAHATHPMGDEVGRDDVSELGDWTAEVSNQLLGGIKARLSPRGYDVWCSTPVVLRGVRLQFVGETVARVMDLPEGQGVAWVQVAWAEEVDSPEGEDVMMPGEMMMF